eukprot:TRINITY_DN9722_c0_g2_i1.p1 TRINITY_DN9722_c0_g2~~TRINITY_DN9722_c0_g2_i1.p1  ORF type:complete len:736 (+),score=111.51 TRINITY_DN9722_c0_g2_i1:130-2337(+)
MGCLNDELQDLFKSLNAFHEECWRYSGDVAASRCLERLRSPLAELFRFAVSGILQDMENHLIDPQVQSMGVHILRAVVYQNATAKHLLLVDGGAEALAKGVQYHPYNEALLNVALETIEEIHGLPTLFQALVDLKASVPGVRASLRAILQSVRARWSEIEETSSVQFLAPLVDVVGAHKVDDRIVISGLELMSELTRESAPMRGAFSATGGWDWTLGLLELHADNPQAQLFGCQLLASLGHGGSWDDIHASRVIAVLENALCKHGEDDSVMYWVLWAALQLNGARLLIVALRTEVLKTPNATVNAIKCLGAITLGQGENASLQYIPGIIDAVVHTMGRFPERLDVLYESTTVLTNSSVFALSELPTAGLERESLTESINVATRALIQLLHLWIADASTAIAACESLAQILETCQDDSLVRQYICDSLLGDVNNPGDHLLSRLAVAHESDHHLQTSVMWIFGVARGVPQVVTHMLEHSTSHSSQMPAIKTLGKMYERIELKAEDAKVLPDALRAVVAAMARFPDDMILQQYACYALCTFAEHGRDEQSQIGDDAFIQCVAAAAHALRLVQGSGDSGCHNALYLRREAARCVATVLSTRPVLGRWLQDNGLHELLVGALESTADDVKNVSRDSNAEETLRLELVALSYVLDPSEAILVPLRRWGSKPAVARAVADAVVELVRRDRSSATGAFANRLRAAGGGEALMAAMRIHREDEDIQTRIHLAIGFIKTSADPAG